jgi:hypothetical protein
MRPSGFTKAGAEARSVRTLPFDDEPTRRRAVENSIAEFCAGIVIRASAPMPVRLASLHEAEAIDLAIFTFASVPVRSLLN